MNRTDRAVVAGLVLLLAIITAAIGAPAFGPGGTGSRSPNPGTGSASPSPAVAYREGIISRPGSINPLTARTQADRDIVALVFSGLVRLGPDGTLVPDLASDWTIDPQGMSYTFTIRPDATWQDGERVTAADVAFTVHVLQDPSYQGPGATSWREVTVTAIDDRTVRFDLVTPVGGFLQAATQPILPEHLLASVPVATMADDRFSQQPVGSGPYRLVEWDALSARLALVPPTGLASGSPAPGGSSGPSAPSPSPTAVPSTLPPGPSASGRPTPSGGPSPSASTSGPAPTAMAGGPPQAIELHFYDNDTKLMADYRAGLLDGASGLMPADAQALAAGNSSRLVLYPRATLTTVVLNLRLGHPEFRNPVARLALVKALDRPAMIGSVLAGFGVRADTPIPPGSWAYAPGVVPPVPFDRKAAAKELASAGWKKSKSGWVAPKGTKAFVIDLITPDKVSNPLVYATAQAVAADWRAFGLTVNVAGLPPRDFVISRLQTGAFSAALLDVNVGLDADLFPFFASSQTATSGANVSGVQNAALDVKLSAARRYATQAKRLAAYRDLQIYLGTANLVLPLYFRDDPVVYSNRLIGPAVHQVADPGQRYWDVLTWRLASGR